jgi:hypothetical protein
MRPARARSAARRSRAAPRHVRAKDPSRCRTCGATAVGLFGSTSWRPQTTGPESRRVGIPGPQKPITESEFPAVDPPRGSGTHGRCR